jgi:ribosomal protein L13E
LEAGFLASQLLKHGVPLKELRESGVNAAVARACGCSCRQMLEAGYDMRSLKDNGFTVNQLHAAGCR